MIPHYFFLSFENYFSFISWCSFFEGIIVHKELFDTFQGIREFEINVVQSYSQIVAAVAEGHADIGVGDITITSKRLEVENAPERENVPER